MLPPTTVNAARIAISNESGDGEDFTFFDSVDGIVSTNSSVIKMPTSQSKRRTKSEKVTV
jgi:hypothetical protein